MHTAIFRRPAPEEAELKVRRRELAALRITLAEREAGLAHLRDQLHSFEARYIRQVGVLYRQLDEWETRIAELKVSRESMHETERLLREAAVKAARNNASRAPLQDAEASQPALDLKVLFRELAKRIHPDFATSAGDERRRTRLMARANEALLREDVAILYRMLHGHDPAGEAADSLSAAEELRRVLARMQDVAQDIATVETAAADLAASDMADLRERTIAAAAQGRDLLAEMAARVKGSIGMAMRRFELDSQPNRRPVDVDPESLLTAEIAPTARRR